MTYIYTEHDYLAHHGVKGMKWGVRRYQNEDGSLKSAGKKRYSSDGDDEIKNAKKAKIKKALKIGATVAATALLTYGAVKVAKEYGKSKDSYFQKMAEAGKIFDAHKVLSEDIASDKTRIDEAWENFRFHQSEEGKGSRVAESYEKAVKRYRAEGSENLAKSDQRGVDSWRKYAEDHRNAANKEHEKIKSLRERINAFERTAKRMYDEGTNLTRQAQSTAYYKINRKTDSAKTAASKVASRLRKRRH